MTGPNGRRLISRQTLKICHRRTISGPRHKILHISKGDPSELVSNPLGRDIELFHNRSAPFRNLGNDVRIRQ